MNSRDDVSLCIGSAFYGIADVVGSNPQVHIFLLVNYGIELSKFLAVVRQNLQ